MITADLSGKRALVTGAAGGLGLCTAELFAEMGAAVAMNDRPDNPRLTDQVRRLGEMGYDVFAASADLTDSQATHGMVVEAAQRLGGLDYLINNAGAPVTKEPIPPGDLDNQSEAFWEKVLSVNLMGGFRTIQAAAPYLRESRGAIVNTSSVAAMRAGGSSMPYCVAKGGVITMTRELARGLAPDVRVNAIAPQFVDPRDSTMDLKWDSLDDDVAVLPIPRPGRGREYAEVTLFLCAGASYMTGVTVPVDGGYNC